MRPEQPRTAAQKRVESYVFGPPFGKIIGSVCKRPHPAVGAPNR